MKLLLSGVCSKKSKSKNLIFNKFNHYFGRFAEAVEEGVGYEKKETLGFLEFFKIKVDPKNEGKVKLPHFKKMIDNRKWTQFVEEESEICLKLKEEHEKNQEINEIVIEKKKDKDENKLLKLQEEKKEIRKVEEVKRIQREIEEKIIKDEQEKIIKQEELKIKRQQEELEIKRQQEELEIKSQQEELEIKRQQELKIKKQQEELEIKRQQELEIKRQQEELKIKRQQEELENKRQQELKIKRQQEELEVKRQEEKFKIEKMLENKNLKKATQNKVPLTPVNIETEFLMSKNIRGMDNSILPIKEMGILKNFLKEKMVITPKSILNLIYKATVHGFASKNFHDYCDGKKRVLVLIKAKGDHFFNLFILFLKILF